MGTLLHNEQTVRLKRQPTAPKVNKWLAKHTHTLLLLPYEGTLVHYEGTLVHHELQVRERVQGPAHPSLRYTSSCVPFASAPVTRIARGPLSHSESSDAYEYSNTSWYLSFVRGCF